MIGITGTPVIDPVSMTLYAIAATKESGIFVHRFHAIDITTGLEKTGSGLAITAPAGAYYDPQYMIQRTGLLLLSGKVYAGFASSCDRNPFNGFLATFEFRHAPTNQHRICFKSRAWRPRRYLGWRRCARRRFHGKYLSRCRKRRLRRLVDLRFRIGKAEFTTTGDGLFQFVRCQHHSESARPRPRLQHADHPPGFRRASRTSPPHGDRWQRRVLISWWTVTIPGTLGTVQQYSPSGHTPIYRWRVVRTYRVFQRKPLRLTGLYQH